MQYWKITDKVLQTSREVLILRGGGFVILLRESWLPGRRWIQRSSSIQQVWHSRWWRHHVHWRGAWTTVKQNKSLWRVPCMPYWKSFVLGTNSTYFAPELNNQRHYQNVVPRFMRMAWTFHDMIHETERYPDRTATNQQWFVPRAFRNTGQRFILSRAEAW